MFTYTRGDRLRCLQDESVTGFEPPQLIDHRKVVGAEQNQRVVRLFLGRRIQVF